MNLDLNISVELNKASVEELIRDHIQKELPEYKVVSVFFNCISGILTSAKVNLAKKGKGGFQ